MLQIARQLLPSQVSGGVAISGLRPLQVARLSYTVHDLAPFLYCLLYTTYRRVRGGSGGVLPQRILSAWSRHPNTHLSLFPSTSLPAGSGADVSDERPSGCFPLRQSRHCDALAQPGFSGSALSLLRDSSVLACPSALAA